MLTKMLTIVDFLLTFCKICFLQYLRIESNYTGLMFVDKFVLFFMRI